ncbi:MAG: GerMN domain-containing protein [Ilumatobacteraceae bacterium]
MGTRQTHPDATCPVTPSLLRRLGGITLGVAVLMGTALTACRVVGEGRVESVDPPFGLADTVVSSTLASTTTSIAPATTEGLATTEPPVQTEQVRLYFIASGRLTYVAVQLPTPVVPAQLVAALQAGPPAGDLGTGLRSALPGLLEINVSTDGSGIAEVTLPDGFFDALTVGDQRLVVAQLVLTLADSRGIGQVTFDEAVPMPSGELTRAGEPLAYRDFESLLVSASGTG